MLLNKGRDDAKKRFSDGSGNAKNIWAKFYEKILNGSEEKRET